MSGLRPFVALAAVVALIGVGVGADALLPAAPPVGAEPEVAGEATSGAWYCAAGDNSGGSAVELVAAVPPRDTSTPAQLELSVAREGATADVTRSQVVPSTATSAPLDEEDGAGLAAVTARWWELPVAVSRNWSVESSDGVSGLVAGPCEREPSDQWVVPGVATAGGAEAELYLANPFESDAAVSITLTTSDGTLAPKLLENVVVPKRSTRVVSLNEHAPERADLGVVVRSRSGRVVAEAVQSFNAAIGGVEGLSLVRAVPELAETWTIPWFLDGGDGQSWLWVTNPDPDRAAAVELTVHTEEGGGVPEALQELTVDPGTVARVDLRDLLPDGVGTGALTVRSDNGVPIATSVAGVRGGPPPSTDDGAPTDEPTDGATEEPTPEPTAVPEGDPDRTGIAVVTGAAAPDTSWVLSGGPTQGRQVVVQMVNASAEEAVVDLAIWAGAGLTRPPSAQGITIPPGAVRTVDVTEELPESGDHTIFVQAQQGMVVAGRIASSTEGRLDLTAATGQAMGVYESGRVLPAVEFVPGMPQRLGTVLGPNAVDDEGPGSLVPSPVPTAPVVTPTAPATTQDTTDG